MARRGRPKTKPANSNQLLIRKRMLSIIEPLDLCLVHQMISPEAHKAGLHLRWLYTLRFGAPSISSTDLTLEAGTSTKVRNTHWQSEKEREYRAAVQLLDKIRARGVVFNVCIYNKLPRILKDKSLHQSIREFETLKEGLEELYRYWFGRKYC